MKKRGFAVLLLTICLMLSGLTIPTAQAYNMPYYIGVDITNQITTIYSTQDDSIVRQMLCSTGKNNRTPLGTFYLPDDGHENDRKEWYYFRLLGCYAKWATRIKGPYLFHSIPYDRRSDDAMNLTDARNFGMPSSHGCIRLRVKDAEFIARNCKRYTKVVIYESGVRDDDLRELLKVSSYTGEDGMTYQEFLGISENDLGRGSQGDEVLSLQLRMNALGYYGGACDGVYGTELVEAVKRLQGDIGMRQSGVASHSLLDLVYSEDAPVSSGTIDLSEGQSGPVVKRLQTALAALKIYDEPIDSVYDVGVIEAVNRFQLVCGYAVGSTATAEQQMCAYDLAAQLTEAMGSADYSIEISEDEAWMATVSANTRIIVRSRPDSDSSEVRKVSNGDTVMIMDSADGWSHIAAPGLNGYMKNKYLNAYQTGVPRYLYASEDGQITFTIGHTMEEYQSGAPRAATEFSAKLVAEQAGETDGDLKDFVTVNTGDDTVKLNLRSAPDGGAEIVKQLDNQTSLRALKTMDEWTMVASGSDIGYLRNEYLIAWQGGADEVVDGQRVDPAQDTLDSDFVEQVQEGATAIVKTGAEAQGVAYVYDSASDDAIALGTLPDGTQVDLLQFVDEEWVLISLQGHQGYMLEYDLEFELEG